MGLQTPGYAMLRHAYFVLQSESLLQKSRYLSSISRHPIVISLPEHWGHSLTFRRWHGGHSHDAQGEDAEGIFRLGLAADIALSIGKAFTGYICGSTAIIADAAHSAADVVSVASVYDNWVE